MKRIYKFFLPVVLLGTITCQSEEVSVDCIGKKTEMACYQIYDPVCGCDGITYGNSCLAQANGVQRISPGSCKN